MRRPHRRFVRRTPHELVLADALACPRARAHDQREGVRSVSILVDRDTRVLVQGITGREGSFHTEQMVEYGTNVVCGVTPGGKGKSVAGAPVFDTVADAVAATEPKVAIMPGFIHTPGPIGVVSRSGTLTYEVVDALSRARIGQSTAVGIGGDPVIGTSFVDVLALFEADPATEAIVMIGEIGGNDEETAAHFIQEHVTKPVVGFIAGQTAPPGKRMGHAGAIISGGSGTAAEKMAALEAAGVLVVDRPSAVPGAIQAALRAS